MAVPLALQAPLARIQITELRSLALLTACTLYAGFSSPTPDNPGPIEIGIALLLLCAIPPGNAARFLQIHRPDTLPWLAGRALFFITLISGTTSALFHGNSAANILRDLIPFALMFLPLLLWPQDKDQNTPFPKLLILCILIIGIGFSLRALIGLSLTDILSTMQKGLIATSENGELLYLANMPTVLFSAIFLCALAGYRLYHSMRLGSLLKSFALLLMAGVPILALSTSLQRASIGALLLALSTLLVIGIFRSPRRAGRIIIPGIALTLLLLPALTLFAELMAQKTVNVGMNMRFKEWQAVMETVTKNPATLLFGIGWGASFASPAVGGIEVNFTHSLLSSMLLKTGLLGLTLTALYLGALARMGLGLFRQSPIIAIAIAAPILIDVLLYASFKSFDFALVLCLIPACYEAARKPERRYKGTKGP